ncbi:uncharacterized protein LOC123557540 [Mercenaria mercenaria]|uniref:uncharacterized protein LOC123557540 n=1 Tax=Mercenaria mercenaria TaxID=6596 RepID=UPI00234EF32C|nr:uncharacterized protein LOC123557540 [Mercenaria mercenaria]
MGCANSSLRPPTEQPTALLSFRQVSMPVHGYLPVSNSSYTQTNNQPNSFNIFQPVIQGSGPVELSVQTDPKLLAMASVASSGLGNSTARKLDKKSVSFDAANLSDKALERINEFLIYLDREELMFKRSDTEVNDIKDAVGKAVDSFGKYIGKKYPLLAVSHKHAVGSFAEGTRLKEPDEFDFILVLKYFNEENVSVDRCMKDCEDIADVKPHAHIKIRNLEWWNAKATETEEWQDNGTVCNWLDFVDMHSFTWAECEWNVDIDTPSGKLSNSETDLEFTSNGPAFTFELLWIPKQGERLQISIDASLALERRGVTEVIELEDVPCQEFIPDLLKEDTHFIVYGEGEDGFKYTFTTTEVKLMRKISASHRRCYRILKFLFAVENCGGIVETYILKTLLLRHANSCMGKVYIFNCLCDICDKLEDLYKKRKGGVSTIFLPDVKKNIFETPQINISRFVLFIENELMKIGKSHQSDNSACLGQLQMMMLMNIANDI